MRVRALAMALCAASPVLAETPVERLDRQCRVVWEGVQAIDPGMPITGRYEGIDGDACLFADLSVVTSGYAPDIFIDELRLRGDLLGLVLLSEVPEADAATFGLQVVGLRMVPQIGDPVMDYIYHAQWQRFAIGVQMEARVSAADKILELQQLSVDFPLDNQVSLSARVSNVDLSSQAALQMSLTSFAVTEAELRVTSHGLFETYVLAVLAPLLLSADGDMPAEEERLRAAAIAALTGLPEASFSPESKDAMARLLQELPNPDGTLTVRMAAEAGFGPARLMAYALTGLPTTLEAAAPLFQGVTLDIDWLHVDAPE
jgi:hypothetical protein